MKNTGIRIETIKEVNGAGEAGYRITAIAALERGDLPLMYLVGNRPDVFLRNDHLVVRSAGDAGTCIYINDFFTQEDMEKHLAHIKAAGQHLADVNRELAEKRKTWAGPVTFVDGISVEKKVSDPAKESGSILERIPRLWAEGRLYFMDDNGVVRPFPKPGIGEVER